MQARTVVLIRCILVLGVNITCLVPSHTRPFPSLKRINSTASSDVVHSALAARAPNQKVDGCHNQAEEQKDAGESEASSSSLVLDESHKVPALDGVCEDQHRCKQEGASQLALTSCHEVIRPAVHNAWYRLEG